MVMQQAVGLAPEPANLARANFRATGRTARSKVKFPTWRPIPRPIKRNGARHTLSGDFHAGLLFGELLLDVLLIIDGATALAKLGAKVPGLLRMASRLEELAPALRGALKTGGATAEDAGTAAERVTPSQLRRHVTMEQVNTSQMVQPVLPVAAQSPMASQAANEAGSIRSVNLIDGKMNCVNCVVATDATLAGRPASAMPGGPYRINALEKLYGTKFGPPSSISDISETISNAGPGARGIVFGSRGDAVGHVFNAINQKGVVRFLDGQTGGAASLDGFQSFQLLRTN